MITREDLVERLQQSGVITREDLVDLLQQGGLTEQENAYLPSGLKRYYRGIQRVSLGFGVCYRGRSERWRAVCPDSFAGANGGGL